MENQIASTSKSNNNVSSNNKSTTSKKKDLNESKPFISRAGQSTTEFVNEFWQHTITIAENSKEDFKHQGLPLARIKKVMRSDPKVKMISSEVTILFEKACQIFIQELTARSHLNSLSSRRRTLSRPDVAQAIAKSDMFDFLIDIVPREEGLIIGGSLGDSRAGGGGGVITGKIGKKNGRGKGKKNKSDTKKRLERREESSEFGDEGEGEGLERGEGSSNKRARIDDDYVSSLMGEGLIHHDLGPEEEEEAEEEEEEEELMLEIGDGSNTSTTLSPYANVEVIDWTANDFKIN